VAIDLLDERFDHGRIELRASDLAPSTVTSGTITFSAGVADRATPTGDLRGLLEAADGALLGVKRSGKRDIAIAAF